MIEFFSNKLAGCIPFATYKTTERMSIEAWIKSQAPSYSRMESPPVSVALNDEIIRPGLWHKVVFKPSDHLQIWHEPKGSDPFTITLALFKGVQAVGKMLVPKMPGTPSAPGSAQGNPIEEASAKGNRVKLGETIRSIAGFQRVYPAYLAEPRSWFASPREKWVEMMLYVSEGEVDIANIKIGQTPIISFGADATYSIYKPGADISGDQSSLLWYNAPEVGASSTGSAGLELTTSVYITPSGNASAYIFDGDSISIPAGSGAFPADWAGGIIVRAIAPYEYTVVDGGAGSDIVKGPLAMLNPFPGMLIEATGTNAGNYVVDTYIPYSPAIPPSPGTPSTLLASSIPSRYDFDVTPLVFAISIGSTPFSISLSTATTNLAGLVSAINTAKGSAPFIASASAGRILITQTTPFDGQPITVAGGSVVFGSAPVSTPGTEATSGSPEQEAQMTLKYDGGEPVNGLAIGTALSSIGPRGQRYRLTAASTYAVTVERLTSSGATDTGWPGFDHLESVSGTVSVDPSSLEGGYRGPIACSPENEKITHIEYTILFQNLVGIGRTGVEYAVSSSHQFEYRDMDVAGAWTVSQRTVSMATRDSVGFTYRIALPYPMRAEARIKRMPKVGGQNSAEVNDDVEWYSLAGLRQQRPTSYPGMTVITLRIRGGDRLASQSESKVSLEGTRVLPLRSAGAWTDEEPTRGIVPWCLAGLKALGYEDQDIDLEEWDRLDPIFTAAGQFYDETIDATKTMKDRLNDALGCGFAELTIRNGLVSLVRDEPRAAFDITYGPKTQTYSPQNMIPGKGLKIAGPHSSINDIDGVDVEYYSQITWAWETVPCRWPGDAGAKVETVKLTGVGDRDRAYRFGMRRRGHQKFRQDTYTWETELSGMNSGYMTFAAVASDTPGHCQSAQVQAVTQVPGGFIITSSEPIDWSAAGGYRLGVSRLDGTLSGPYPATQVDETHAFITDLDFSPDTSMSDNMMLPQLLIGPESKWAYPVLVLKADPSNGNVAMKGMPYDERVYTYDNATAP